jgi:hypothetical protein
MVITPVVLALYLAGGSADAWSSRPPQGYSYSDRSFAGPLIGPCLTSAAFIAADALLGHSKHPGWQRALRIGYAVGITSVALHNRSMRPH